MVFNWVNAVLFGGKESKKKMEAHIYYLWEGVSYYPVNIYECTGILFQDSVYIWES